MHYCYNIFTNFYYISDYDMALLPEEGTYTVAIHRDLSEDDRTISRTIQRALPPSREESMALAIESSSPPNSKFFKLFLCEFFFIIINYFLYKEFFIITEQTFIFARVFVIYIFF